MNQNLEKKTVVEIPFSHDFADGSLSVNGHIKEGKVLTFHEILIGNPKHESGKVGVYEESYDITLGEDGNVVRKTVRKNIFEISLGESIPSIRFPFPYAYQIEHEAVFRATNMNPSLSCSMKGFITEIDSSAEESPESSTS